MEIQLSELVESMNQLLKVAEIPDYSGAHNGLQIGQGQQIIKKVVAAVDASAPVIEEACAADADLLIVHHGLFWQGSQMLTGKLYQKYQHCFQKPLAIYSSHIPLDVHEELGNNIQLSNKLFTQDHLTYFEKRSPFFPWKGIELGLHHQGSWQRGELAHALEQVLGLPVHLCPGGPEICQEIGIITGGAGSEVERMAATGIDTFITGEGPHWSYPLAEELGINLFYAGHYATETFGVQALAGWLEEHYDLPWEFIDHPTGL